MSAAPAPAPLAKKLATLLAGEAAVSLASSLLARTSLLALVVETVIAEVSTSRLGVEWQRPTSRTSASVGKGVAFGLGLAALVMTASLALNHGEIVGNRPVLATLAVAAVTALLAAVRDELLLRGGPIRLVLAASPTNARPGWTSAQMIIVCTAIGAAHAASESFAAQDIVAGAAIATIFAALWCVDDSALRPVAAHAAFAFAESGLVGSGVLDLRGGALGASASCPRFAARSARASSFSPRSPRPSSPSALRGPSRSTWANLSRHVSTAEEFFYHLYRATDLLDDGQLDEARHAIERAHALDPADPRLADLRSRLDISPVRAAPSPAADAAMWLARRSFTADAHAPASTHDLAPASAPTRASTSPAAQAPASATSTESAFRALRVADLFELTMPRDARAAVRLDALRAFGAAGGALLERSPKIPGASSLLGGTSRPFVTLQGAQSTNAQSPAPDAMALLGPRPSHRLEILPLDPNAPLFVREELLVAFDLALTYECARLTDAELDVVQLRASTNRDKPARLPAIVEPQAPLLCVPISASQPLHVRRDRLVAWSGRLLPQPVPPQDALASQRGLLRLIGDGAVFLSLA